MYGQLDLEYKTPVERAIARLKSFEPAEGYYLAFSGGKDSVALLGLTKEAGVKFDAHHSLTTIDPPELVKFIKTFPEVQIERPPKTFHQLVYENGLPRRQGRWCCKHLKERGGKGRIVLTGVRYEESARRRTRGMVETCYLNPSKRFLHTIIDWSTSDVWEYIKSNNLSYCSLYDEGFKRLGCVLCPMVRDIPRHLARFPKTCEAIKRSAFRYWGRQTKGSQRFPTPESLWEWWLNRDSKAPSEYEQRLFD